MILELDCGNTLIKWRIIDTDTYQVLTRGSARNTQQLLTDIDNTPCVITWCRLVSVRSQQEATQLIRQLELRYPTVQQAVSTPHVLGVTNGYHDYTQLGVDRWLAIIASYHKYKQASLILSFGTAITSDFVTSQGQHLGGFIAPGSLLMRQQLLNNTGQIHYHESMVQDMFTSTVELGNSTEQAVNSGCQLMLQGFIDKQLVLANHYLSKHFNICLTGGDAKYLNIPGAHYIPDLVFDGLALLCPFAES